MSNKADKINVKTPSKGKNPETGNDRASNATNKFELVDLDPAVRSKCLKEMTSMYPTKVQSRLVALNNIQLQLMEHITVYQNEIWELEKKLYEKYKPHYDQRAKIIIGELELPKEEAVYKEQPMDEEETTEDFSEKLKPWTALPTNVKGVPNFWLTVLKGHKKTAKLIYDPDEEVLKSLYDIKIVYKSDSFILEFHFKKNRYFKNRILEKNFKMIMNADDVANPFHYKKPDIIATKGCKINWEPGMNLTRKIVKSNLVQIGLKRRFQRQDCDSFFNFFDQSLKTKDTNDDEETQAVLAEDIEAGEAFKNDIIPYAVLYFTGDRMDSDDDDSDDETDEDEEESDAERENAESEKDGGHSNDNDI